MFTKQVIIDEVIAGNMLPSIEYSHSPHGRNKPSNWLVPRALQRGIRSEIFGSWLYDFSAVFSQVIGGKKVVKNQHAQKQEYFRASGDASESSDETRNRAVMWPRGAEIEVAGVRLDSDLQVSERQC